MCLCVCVCVCVCACVCVCVCVCLCVCLSTYRGKCDELNQEEERREPGTTLYLIEVEYMR